MVQNHFFPPATGRSGCWKYDRPLEIALRTKMTSSGKTFIQARPVPLKPGKVMDRKKKELTDCLTCLRLPETLGAK